MNVYCSFKKYVVLVVIIFIIHVVLNESVLANGGLLHSCLC